LFFFLFHTLFKLRSYYDTEIMTEERFGTIKYGTPNYSLCVDKETVNRDLDISRHRKRSHVRNLLTRNGKVTLHWENCSSVFNQQNLCYAILIGLFLCYHTNKQITATEEIGHNFIT